MRYIRVRASKGAGVAPSCRIARGLSVLALHLAPSCVPTGDLSSYSTATSDATGDVGGGPGLSPARSPTAQPDEGIVEAPRPASRPGESIVGGDAPLDPGMSDDTSSTAPPGDDGADSNTEPADAGPPSDAGPPPFTPAPDLTPARPPTCSLGESTGPNAQCYVRVATPLDWDAARANCQRRGLGWDLASIRSLADSAFVVSLLDDEAWVGGSDGQTEETWTWVANGFQFWQGEGAEGQPLNGAFVNWFDDEPNGSTSSDCLRLLDDSRWADLECGEQRPSVCQGPPS